MFEQYFTPYQASCAVLGERIAILAPHPDDEVFGCGASACKWREQGKQVQAFIITNGVVLGEFDDQPDSEGRRQHKKEIRADESRVAAGVLGLPEPEFLHRQDGGVWDDEEVESLLFSCLGKWLPTTLVLPSVWEMHRDHRAIAEIGIRLAQRLPSVEQVTFYEVGVPLTPNVLEDVSGYYERKWQAMQSFPSQLSDQNYAEQMRGLNTFRSYTLGLGVSYAEAFFCIAKEELGIFEQKEAPSQYTLVVRNVEQNRLKELDQLHQMSQCAEQQKQRIEELEHLLYQTHQTLSWRLTAPIRWLRRRFY